MKHISYFCSSSKCFQCAVSTFCRVVAADKDTEVLSSVLFPRMSLVLTALCVYKYTKLHTKIHIVDTCHQAASVVFSHIRLMTEENTCKISIS